MTKLSMLVLALLIQVALLAGPSAFLRADPDTLGVRSVSDFELDGKGSHPNWALASWVDLTQLEKGLENYQTRFKILYSATGIYVLFEGLDKKITSNYKKDFENLFNADVFEVFFHPEPAIPLYFEYEVNAHNKELVLLIPQLKGIMGWIPWHYTGDRKVRKEVVVHKKKRKMEKWSAELFFPFKLLSPLQNVPPTPGSCWRANFYRIDYDSGAMVKFAWSPIEKTFHEIARFGVIRFE